MDDKSDFETNEDYSLIMSFWIDTDGYCQRDRQMFVAGVEFQMVFQAIQNGTGWNQCIHAENSSRVRMMCAKLKCPFSLGDVGMDEWVQLTIPKRPARGLDES